MFNKDFFFKCGNMEKYSRSRQATDEKVVHLHCMLYS